MTLRLTLPYLSSLRPAALPFIVLLAAWFSLPYMPRWHADYALLLQALPYGLGVLLLLLTQLFNQGRIGQMAILTLVTYALVQQRLQVQLSDADTYWAFFWLCLLWPVNVALIRYLPERRPFSLGGMIFPAILSLQFLVLAALSISDWYSASLNWTAGFREQASAGLLPLPAWISFTLSAALIINRLPQQSDTPLALLALLLLHGWLFYRLDASQISVLVSSLSLLLLFATLLINNHHLAFIDELTGLPGRRALMNDLKHRHGRYLLVMADIDHFKQFNDTHGHDVGDDVLRLVAAQLNKTSGGGRAYRYGGEEFTLIFPSSELSECLPFIEATRERIASYPLVVRNRQQRPETQRQGKKQRGQSNNSKTLNVTMSFGAARRNSGESIEELMKRADKALYKAKENGRNRVEKAK
jgi:diguanylate cyclase (GGDEF)-like protein